MNIIFIIFFGLMTSFIDIKKGKIKNNQIFSALLFILIFNFIFFHSVKILINTILTMLSALFIGVILWMGNLWSPGDAKLFVAYTGLISNILTSKNILTLPFLILLNTATPFFFFYSFLIFKKTTKRDKKRVLKNMLNLKLIFQISLFIFSFSWIINLLFQFLHLPNNYFITIITLFIILEFIKKTKLNFQKILVLLSIIRIIFDFSKIFSISFFVNFIFIVFIFMFLRFFILNLGAVALSNSVKIDDLKPGMILLDRIKKKDDKYLKESGVEISLLNLLIKKTEKYFIENRPEGLSEEEVNTLKKLKKEGKLNFEYLLVHQTLPFAPLLFLGTLLTLISGDNIFLYIFKKILLR